MITTYSSYIQRLDVESLEQYVPSGDSFTTVVLKEILDNALDAAEMTGDSKVIITTAKNYIDISNCGEIPKQVIKNLKKPDNNTSEKFKQFSYKRGAIGQGLKIAISMATITDNYFSIETGKTKYEISILDRNPKKPSDALDIETVERTDDGYTHIIFYCDQDQIMQVLRSYLIVNPNITFIEDGHVFKNTCDIKKNLKNDISQYSAEDLTNLLNFYELNDIIDSFDIPAYHKNKIKNVTDIKKYAKPTKPCIFGEDALKQRARQILETDILGYKKIDIEGGVLELAVLSHPNEIFIGINGSPLSEYQFFITEPCNKKTNRALIMPLSSFLEDLKFKKGLIVIYHCSKPNYKDANKQSILINPSEKEFSKISHFLKNFANKRTNYDNWHLCSSKDELIQKIVETANETYNEMGLQITIRQLYYQLVSRGLIVNGKYNTLNPLLTDLREKGILDWRLFEDRSRVIYKPETIEPCIDIKKLMLNYIETLSLPPINKWYAQQYYLELWYEKDALSSYFQSVADKWQIVSFATRGFNSTTNNKESLDRFFKHEDKQCLILYCGDYDPFGIQIYKTLLKKIKKIKIDRIALTKEQIEKYNLIEMPEMKGKNLKERFIAEYGDKAYELDALPAKELMSILDNAISEYLNPELYDDSKQLENENAFEKIKNNIIMNRF